MTNWNKWLNGKKICDVNRAEGMRIYSLRNNRLGYNTSGILIRVEYYKGPYYQTTNYNTQQGFRRHSLQQSFREGGGCNSLLPYWFPVGAYTHTINGQVIVKMNNFFKTAASEILTANGLSSQKIEKGINANGDQQTTQILRRSKNIKCL
jgi:hypothetical protein